MQSPSSEIGFDFKNFDKNFKTVVEKQLINQSFYPKFVVSDRFVSKDVFQDDTYHIDNGLDIISVPAKTLKSVIPLGDDESFVGYSLPFTMHRYRSNMEGRIKFRTILDDHPFGALDINKFYNSIKGLQDSTQKGLLLLSPCKGGFKCYSGGLIGFLPSAHADFFISNAFRNSQAHLAENKSPRFLMHSLLKRQLCWIPAKDFKIVPSITALEKKIQVRAVFLVDHKLLSSKLESEKSKFLRKNKMLPETYISSIESALKRRSSASSFPAVSLKLTDSRHLENVPFHWKRFFTTALKRL